MVSVARGGVRAAAMYTLIVTAKLNAVDPQAWLADVLARIAGLPHTRVRELLTLELESRPAPRPWPHRPVLTSRSVSEPAGCAGADLTSRSLHRMGTVGWTSGSKQ